MSFAIRQPHLIPDPTTHSPDARPLPFTAWRYNWKEIILSIGRATRNGSRKLYGWIAEVLTSIGRAMDEGAELHNRVARERELHLNNNWFYLRNL